MDDFLTVVHVISGSLGLVTGYIILFMKKGDYHHKLLGKIYVVGMSVVAISALIIMAAFRFNFFLFAIGVFGLYLVVRGYTIVGKKKELNTTFLDYLLLVWIVLGALGLLGFGVYLFNKNTLFSMVSFFFAFFAGSSALTEWKMIKGKYKDKKLWWLNQHISSMLASFIAANTAFLVQNGGRFFPEFRFSWMLWVAPTILITPLIFRWTKQYAK